MSNLKVAVLVPPETPDNPADRADTYLQATQISECLSMLGNQCLTIIFANDRAEAATALRHAAPDVVVNLVEDVPEGADHLHLAPAMLDALGLRYTGAPTATLAALADKRQVRAALCAASLPVAPGLDEANEWTNAADDSRHLFIVKSAIEHASIGLDAASVVTGPAAARATIAERQARFGGNWFAEAYIDGREFNVSLLDGPTDPTVLPIAEILFLAHAERPKIVGYAEKWAETSAAYAETPRVFPDPATEQELFAELARLGLETWRLFGLRGYARIDFRVAADGQPYILDVNANPCLARDAGFCAAAKQAGLNQADIVAQLLETARA